LLRRAVAVALLAVLVPAAALAQANGKLQLHHIKVGQGDGILLISPLGQTALFDDGVYTNCTEIKNYISGLGISVINYHFTSHYHADHIGCIDDLAAIGITIGTTGYDRGYSYSSGTYTNYVNTLGAKRATMAKNQVVTLDSGASYPVSIKCVDLNGAGVYSPTGSDENAKSMVMKVSYGSFDEVIGGDLTGDGSLDVESTIGPMCGDVEVYKVHHHGSLYSSNDNWLNAISAEVGIIQVGNGNTYGHPTSAALGRMHAHGIKTYWTETGAGASPDGAWDVVANGAVVVNADPGSSQGYTVSGPGFSHNYFNGGAPPPIHTTEYPSSLTMLKGTLTTGDVTRLQVSDNSRIGVAAGVTSGQYYTDWYASVFLLHPPLNLTVTCETSFTVSRTQTLYVWNWSTSAWVQVNSGTVSTTDVTKVWSTATPANYVGPSREVRFRVKGNNRTSTYTSRGDFMKFEYDYTSGTGPMLVAERPSEGFDAVLAAMPGEDTGSHDGHAHAELALAGAPGSEAGHLDRERAAAMNPQAALRALQAVPVREGTSLRWTVGVNDHVDGFNIYRETSDRMLVFAGNEAGLEVSGEEVAFRFLDAGAPSDATYWLGVRSCAGPEALVGPIRVEAAAATTGATAELALRISPNPAAGGTHFEFALDRDADVTLEVFDLAGRRVATPIAGRLPAGPVRAGWNLRRDDGSTAEPGLYFARLQTLGRTLFSRVTVVAR
jgi:beta-lactamase superfamily II metal-dependent hydrolase